MCCTGSSGERGRRLSGVERSGVVSDNAATDGGRWRSARSDDAGRGKCWRRVGGRVQLLVLGETRMQSSHYEVMAEEGLVGGVALLRCQTVL